MTDIRDKHVGKSNYEKETYNRMIRTQQPEDPTFEEYESLSTNSMVKDDEGKSSITQPSLKPYMKASNIPWREIISGIVVTAVTAILFLLGMSLNRDVGILFERTSNISTRLDAIQEDVDSIQDELRELSIKMAYMNSLKIK